MEPPILAALRRSRPELLSEWRRLLRAEKVVSALAQPASLENLMSRTLDDLAILLGEAAAERPGKIVRATEEDVIATREWPPDCRCGMNPFLAYYRSGETAIGLVFEEVGEGVGADQVAEAKTFWRVIAREELDAFCGVCQLDRVSQAKAGVRRRSKPGMVRRRLLPASRPSRRISARV